MLTHSKIDEKIENTPKNLVRIPIPKQIIKRHIQRTLRRPFFNFLVIGILLLGIAAIYVVINPETIRRKDAENEQFQSLCPNLKLHDPSQHFKLSFQFEIPDVKVERKDWHDYEAMLNDKKRTGPGEQGIATFNRDETKKQLEEQLIKENNFNALLSEMISCNRSVPDIRPKKCLSKRYLAKLPSVSIVIPCRNEFYSVLQRSLHSIVNRTPRELLKEIIIVDDHSTRGYSVSEMELYAERHFPNLVRFVRLPERKGLMYVRTAGAKVAISDVIVFMDCHIECNYNWLPPLLEPIAINDRITTTPIIDKINHTTFQYQTTGYWRGGPTWQLDFTMRPLRTGPDVDETKPYKDAVMLGGLFAISRRFFWEIGGYDVNLDTWGGEQFEISFKIWMCGGMLLVTLCSRVGHIFVVPYDNKISPKDAFYMERNKKRVAEVWMDEYKHYGYLADPQLFYQLDAGDLTAQHAVRKRLKCKSYKWFLEFVAPDFREEHPFDLPADFANGTIESVAFPNYCLDTLGQFNVANVGIYQCAENRKTPHINQLWNFNFYNELKNFLNFLCLDVFEQPPNAHVKLFGCHREGGNQFWRYDKDRKWLVHGKKKTQTCLEVLKVNTKFQIVVNECVETNRQMQWNFGFVNEMLLANQLMKEKPKMSSNKFEF